MVLIFTSCLRRTPRHFTLRATVVDVYDGAIFVAPVEEATVMEAVDMFSINLDELGISPDLQVGDVVDIVYGGNILELYAANPAEFVSITVVEPAADP